jgi:hypothetical protein
MDSLPLPFTPRSRSLTLGGLTVTTALIPPSDTVQVWGNADGQGNLFGELAFTLSNDLQIRASGGTFSGVEPISDLVINYAPDNANSYRVGGKAVFLHQLRGFPFSLAGDVTYGRTSGRNQGYVFSQLVATWEANSWLAFHLNPKVLWSGIDIPYGLGLAANIQLGEYFQLIPEFNLVPSDAGESNATLALRWLPVSQLALDFYVSNAAGLLDVGQLLQNEEPRFGTKVTFQF